MIHDNENQKNRQATSLYGDSNPVCPHVLRNLFNLLSP